MKKIIIALCFLLSFLGVNAQGGWLKPSNSYGTIENRRSVDSTLFYPTGCGTPSLQGYNLRKSAFFYDSCNHRLWAYDPKLSAWDSVHLGKSSVDSALFKTVWSARQDSIALASLTLDNVTANGNTTNNTAQFGDELSLKNTFNNKIIKLSSFWANGSTKTIYLPNRTGTLVATIKGDEAATNGDIDYNLYRRTDSVFYKINTNEYFAYKDSTGSGGGADSTIFSTNYRRDTAISHVRSELNAIDLQQVTDIGSTTSNSITAANLTSLGDFTIGDATQSGSLNIYNPSGYVNAISVSDTTENQNFVYPKITDGVFKYIPTNVNGLYYADEWGRMNIPIGGADSTIFSTNYRRDTAIANVRSQMITAFVSDTIRAKTSAGHNIKNSTGTTVATFGTANTTNITLSGATNVSGALSAQSTFTATGTTTLNRTIINKDSITITTGKKWLIVSDTTTGQLQRTNIDSIIRDKNIATVQGMGSVMKAATTNPFMLTTNQFSLTDNRMYVTPIWLEAGTVLGGAGFIQSTQGNYTADGYNGIAVFSYDGAGTFTVVDSTINDGNFWKGASGGTVQKKAFAIGATITQTGRYFVGAIYNSSSQSVAPQMYTSSGATSVINALDFTNSVKLGYVTATNVPTTFAASSLVNYGGFMNFLFVY